MPVRNALDESALHSRFIRTDDPHTDTVVWRLPGPWWSRPHEYAWAASFAGPGDVALDAACGVGHTFKFLLGQRCREVHAVDTDERLLNDEEVSREVNEGLVTPVRDEEFRAALKPVIRHRASILALPFADRYFDRVYCISVLEHLDDTFNRRAWLIPVGRALGWRLFRHDMLAALGEFRRVLKDDGMAVLTFDFPRVNLGYLRLAVASAGLRFAAGVSLDEPDDRCLHSQQHRLWCFRAVLVPAGDSNG